MRLRELAIASLCLAQMCDAFTHPTALFPTAAARAALPAQSRCSATQPRIRMGLGRKEVRLTRLAAAGDGGMEKGGKMQDLLGKAKLVSSLPAIRIESSDTEVFESTTGSSVLGARGRERR
jgi:hypothetical protein